MAAVLGVLGGGACTSGSSAEPPRATVGSTTTSTVPTTTTEAPPEFEPLIADPELSLHDQVEAAYLFHWEVLLDAYRTGRVEALPLVYGPEMVEFRSEEIAGLAADGHLVDGEVGHNYEVVEFDAENASVVDVYTNKLVLVDAATGAHLEEPSEEQVGYEFQMQKVEGQWLVVHVVRYHFSD